MNHSAELAAIELVDYLKYSIDSKCSPVNIYIALKLLLCQAENNVLNIMLMNLSLKT